MVMVAVFAAGSVCGIWLGVFSLVTFGGAVCMAAFVAGWGEGAVAACAQAMEMWAILIAGFLVALAGVSLAPESLAPESLAPGQPLPAKKWTPVFREKRAKTEIF
jgi:hypothetical protein